MACILSICKYISTILVVLTLCTLPTCYSGKKNKLSKNNPSGLRQIKISHKKYSRKLRNARSVEDFLKVFEKNVNAERRIQELILLDETLPDQRGSIHRLLQRPDNEHNVSLLMSQIGDQLNAVQCAEPRPVLLNTYEVLGLTPGLLQFVAPRCLLVNRCGEHSGCCVEGESCRVAQGSVRNVTRQVMMVHVYVDDDNDDDDDSIGRDHDVVWKNIEVEEHTRCECKQLYKRRKCADVQCPDFKTKDKLTCSCLCHKRCPNPYISNPDTCKCECAMDSTTMGRDCRKIYRGKEQITTPECRCIRSKQCNEPVCRSRYHFNSTTCNCVRNEVVERIADDDSYGGLFAADLEVRSRDLFPPGKLSSDEEGHLLHSMVRSKAVPMVRSMQRSGFDEGNQEKIKPKLGDVSPEASEYRHSSHTSYNDTHSVHATHNVSGSTKAKITVWEKSSDDLNATNIKDKTGVSLQPNGTEHQTISTRQSANLNPLPNAVSHLPEKPVKKDDTNFINSHVLGEEEAMVTMNTGYSSEFYQLHSSSDSISYSSWNSLDEVEKEEDILDLFSDDVENEDIDAYKFTESSGDYTFGGY